MVLLYSFIVVGIDLGGIVVIAHAIGGGVAGSGGDIGGVSIGADANTSSDSMCDSGDIDFAMKNAEVL